MDSFISPKNDFMADEFIFLFSSSRPPSKTLFPSCVQTSDVLYSITWLWSGAQAPTWVTEPKCRSTFGFVTLTMIMRNSSIDWWLWAVRRERQQSCRFPAKDQTTQGLSEEYFFNLRVNTKIMTRVSTSDVPRVDDVCIYRQKNGEGSCVQ